MTGDRLVVFPDADPDLDSQLDQSGGDLLGGLATLRVFVGRPSSTDEYIDRVAGASALLLGWDLPTPVIEVVPSIEAVSFLGSGVSNFVDVEAASRAGVTVMNVPRYGDTAVAEHTLALVLAAMRRIVEYDHLVRGGGWGVAGFARELDTTTLGLLGLGGIGGRVAGLASSLGMRVVAWTRSGRPGEVRSGATLRPLDAVLAESDVVSLHLPLAPGTEGILSGERLAQMRPGSILVNTARAELVDESGLVAALEYGPLAAAALDVSWSEPPPADHPLLRLENVILTPHVAFATREASQRLLTVGIQNIVDYFGGRPHNVVGPSA